MANDNKQAATESTSELDAMAFEIYKEGVKASPVNRGSERLAIAAYQKAEVFLAVRKRLRSGQIKPKEESKLADCCAPNLRRTHPINLVSQQFGDLEKVQRIKKFLDANPTPTEEPEQVVTKINRAFPDLGWDLAVINTARNILPAYCNN